LNRLKVKIILRTMTKKTALLLRGVANP
jgi:hypothetical protein